MVNKNDEIINCIFNERNWIIIKPAISHSYYKILWSTASYENEVNDDTKVDPKLCKLSVKVGNLEYYNKFFIN